MTKKKKPETPIAKLERANLILRDENRKLRQAYMGAQRENAIFDALVDEMEHVIEPMKPPARIIQRSRKTKLVQESLVMHLTDGHTDQIVRAEQVGGLENYDFNIACRRAETYIEAVIKFTQKTLVGYQFPTLWILAHGDHVSGEIHKAVDHSQYRNMFKNALATGQLHGLMLYDLAKVFQNIKIVYLSGNHGRRSLKKDYHSPHDNWDYLVAETARLYCKDIKNIEFLIPDSFSTVVQIEGYNFFISHGDDIRSWNGIPWYGIERKTRRLTALHASLDQRIDYFCFGHFHNSASQDALKGETIINGAWVACDPYCFHSLSVYTEPKQWLHGVHRERGVSWRIKVNLRSKNEQLGPKRYRVKI